MDIGPRLIELRQAKGYTTNRLANLAGISQSFLRDIEHQKKRPTVDTLSLLCDALGLSLRDFFDTDQQPKDQEQLLLIRFRRLPPRQREALLTLLDDMNQG